MTPTLIFLTKSFLTKHSENIAQSKRILTQNILKDIHTIVKFIWPVWLNLWAFVSELYGCGFESRCYHWNFRYKELVPSKQIIDIQAISESNSLDTCMWQKQKNTVYTPCRYVLTTQKRPNWLNNRVFVSELNGCGFKIPLLVLKHPMERLFRARGSLAFNKFQSEDSLNSFVQMHLFSTPWKHVQGVDKGCTGNKWVNTRMWHDKNTENKQLRLQQAT